MKIPIGEESAHEGVVDLLRMKGFYFEGEMGTVVREAEIPENLKVQSDEYHKALIEKIVENDDDLMSLYLEGKEILCLEVSVPSKFL